MARAAIATTPEGIAKREMRCLREGKPAIVMSAYLMKRISEYFGSGQR
jgi:hypothetical protein